MSDRPDTPTGDNKFSRPPRGRQGVECALCGARRWNDESVIWLGPSWDERLPYCAESCAQSWRFA